MAYKQGNPRYQRQTALKELGDQGQEKLQDAKVLVIGAGGLGSPALQYLAGAGIGTLGIVDHDLVSLSNLHRQTLYSADDTGLSKALRAQEILAALNPEIDIISYNEMLNSSNALNIISGFGIILDGTDNFASRYLINDACVLLNKPLVYGAISRFEGQIAVFNQLTNDTPVPANYRDLFPDPPGEGEILNCEEAGVLGTLPGIIGTMMANEAIKLITGIGKPLINTLMTYNSLNNLMYEMEIQAAEHTRSLIPADQTEFRNTDYEWLCSSRSELEVDRVSFDRLINDKSATFIDVREPDEMPFITEFDHIKIPLGEILENAAVVDTETIVLFCQSGIRSLTAAGALTEKYGNSKKVYSLRGGILNWKNLKRS
ncbi:HesA/MoeB/ThiF family protein [Daejeonella sp. JGW-45]|uniref:HesA/MoeB/ThiF family protein n=1 Tax=Daejeonella sp. JGW-45 TaxID=3034148 RepID=UPI0023EB3C70|nr:HesA/MoeB/ThiF family protein [Daejeonella sp. JGW-45]